MMEKTRAVFSDHDIELVRFLVTEFLNKQHWAPSNFKQDVYEDMEKRAVSLYHRLGRLG